LAKLDGKTDVELPRGGINSTKFTNHKMKANRKRLPRGEVTEKCRRSGRFQGGGKLQRKKAVLKGEPALVQKKRRNQGSIRLDQN